MKEQNKRKRGCLYWLLFGWCFEFAYWVIFGWWVKPLLYLNQKLKEKNEVNSQSTQDNFQFKNQFNAITEPNQAPKFIDGIPLANNYKREELCQIRGEEPDVSKLKVGDKLELVSEPQNAYDNKAIAVYHGTDKLGYIYRGKVQDTVNEFLADNQTRVFCFISDIVSFYVYMNIGCYSHSHHFRPNKEMSFKLIRTSSAEIQCNIGNISLYEDLEFEMDLDKNLIEFFTGSGVSAETIGYAPKNKTSILQAMYNPSKYNAYVSEIEDDDDDKYSVYVTIEYEE